MRKLFAISLFTLFAASAGVVAAQSVDAETIAAINGSSKALDAAFAARDVDAIRSLMTADHISVTPYYDGPQSVDDQIASLPEFDFSQTILGEPSVVLLSPKVALRTFVAGFEGAFKGKPLPTRVFVNETLINRDGKWIERFFQVTAMP